MDVSFSIIIPVYNEVNIIEKFVVKLHKAFRNLNVKYIFIDDGSKDGSKNWLENNLQNFIDKNNYELILLKKNKGKGFAVRKGIEKIQGNYTIFIDSDLEYDPDDALDLYKIVNENKNIKALLAPDI